jgi:hypothetical protein
LAVGLCLFGDSVVNHISSDVVGIDDRIKLSSSIDDADVLVGNSSVYIHTSLDESNVSNLLLSQSLLIDELGINNSIFKFIWQFYLEKHEASAVSISFLKFGV